MRIKPFMAKLPVPHERSLEVITPSQEVKRWTDWKSTILLGSRRVRRAQGKPLSPRLERQTGEQREAWFTGLSERRPTRRNCFWNQYQGRKISTVTDKLLQAHCGQVWELKTSGEYCEIKLQELNQIPTVLNIREKNPLLLPVGRGEEKEPFWNMPEHSVLTRPALREKS